MTQTKNKKNTYTLTFLLLLFIVPLGLAFWMYSSGKTPFQHTTNRGQLIQPVLNTAPLHLGLEPDYWWLVYVSPNTCDPSCEKILYNIRQIHTATGKDSDRVKRAILTFTDTAMNQHVADSLKTDFAGTVSVTLSRSLFTQFLNKQPGTQEAIERGGIYLIDPMGNIMMFYALSTPPMDIFKDLTHLLKISAS